MRNISGKWKVESGKYKKIFRVYFTNFHCIEYANTERNGCGVGVGKLWTLWVQTSRLIHSLELVLAAAVHSHKVLQVLYTFCTQLMGSFKQVAISVNEDFSHLCTQLIYKDYELNKLETI